MKIFLKIFCIFAFVFFLLAPVKIFAQADSTDSDQDGLSDYEEINIYFTNPKNPDTDGDGYLDGTEIKYNYDPNKAWDDKLKKTIGISLKEQTLTTSLGPYVIKTIKVSTGLPRTPTPKGNFEILAKKPQVTYRGADYFYPNTRWNIMFKTGTWGNYYIHGAYWHHNFGKQMSRGCVNVAYEDMEALYNWADETTKIFIE